MVLEREKIKFTVKSKRKRKACWMLTTSSTHVWELLQDKMARSSYHLPDGFSLHFLSIELKFLLNNHAYKLCIQFYYNKVGEWIIPALLYLELAWDLLPSQLELPNCCIRGKEWGNIPLWPFNTLALKGHVSFLLPPHWPELQSHASLEGGLCLEVKENQKMSNGYPLLKMSCVLGTVVSTLH